MKLKSLLIGSAAALVAATGASTSAQAADAVVVAEPEPVEYVRICDAFGAGFFYIPGTETCLRISGQLRAEINATSGDIDPVFGNFGVLAPAGALGPTAVAQRGWSNWHARARINLDARSDTEWGVLRGFIRLQADWRSAANNVGLAGIGPGGIPTTVRLATTDGVTYIDWAIIEIGGLRVGYGDTAYVTTQYGGSTGYGSLTDGGLSYGYAQVNMASYSFAFGNGAFATISLEDDANANYIPDLVGSVGVNQAWGAAWFNVGYDEDISPGAGFAFPPIIAPTLPLLSGVDGWSAKLGVHLNVPNSSGSAFRVIGFYSENANRFSVGSRWSVLASYQHVFSPTLSSAIGFQYMSDTNFAAAGRPTAWALEANVSWTPVNNFNVLLEVLHAQANPVAGPTTRTTSGFLRFTRSF